MPDASLKPAKPYPDFALTPHSSGKWAKKIRGRFHYFGRWDDADGALREYNAVKEALHAGRTPTVVAPGNVTVKDLFNLFLERQVRRVDAGRLEALSYQDARNHLLHFAKAVGPNRPVAELRPVDFRAAREGYAAGRSPHTLNRYISNVKTVYNWGILNGHVNPPVLYGDAFSKESKRVQLKAQRQNRYRRGGRETFTSCEVGELLKLARPPVKAMILLGLNAGFYAIDVAGLPFAAIDLDDAWLEYPRAKTEVMRAAPLWPETVEAIGEAIAVRGKPKNPADQDAVFVTKHGNRWVHVKVHREEGTISRATRSDAINHAFTKLLDRAGIRRRGINFAALRDTFITLANEVGDQNAEHLIRGHSFPGMDAYYVKDVARPRLERVTDHVRRKLLNPKVVRARARAESR